MKQIISKFLTANALETCSKVVVIFGIVLFFIGYYFDFRAELRDNTIEFAQLYHRSPYVEHQTKIRAIFLTPAWVNLSKKSYSISNYEAFLEEETANPVEVKQSLIVLINFFRTLDLCVQNNRCDSRTATEIFTPTVALLMCGYLPWLDQLAESNFSNPREILESIASKEIDCEES